MPMIKYVPIFLFCLWASTAQAFNLSVTASAPSRSWNDGVLEIVTGDTVTFDMTASGGTGPYTYEWNFGDYGHYKSRYADGGSIYDDEDPVRDFDYAGRYDVEVIVTDTGDGNTTEMAYISIDVLDVRSPVQDAINNCGAAGDNVTDDTSALQTCLNNMTSGGVLDLGSNTYRIVGVTSGSASSCGPAGTRGLCIQNDNIAIIGEGATLRWDITDAACIDHVYDGGQDFFLTNDSNSHTTLFRGVNFTYELPSGRSHTDCDNHNLVGFGQSAGQWLQDWAPIFQNGTITGFSGVGDNRASAIRNNIDQWGEGYDTPTRQAAFLAKGQQLNLRNYVTPKSGNSHYYYINQEVAYNFMFENWVYMSSPEDNSTFFKIYARSSGADFTYIYVQSNYLEGPVRFASFDVKTSSGTTAAGPIHIKDNYFVDGIVRYWSIWLGKITNENYWTDVVISGNKISEIGASPDNANAFTCCGESGYACSACIGSENEWGSFSMLNNEYGSGFSSGMSPNSLTDSDTFQIDDESAMFPSGATLTGNSYTGSNYKSSTRGGSGPEDPGPWEFT
ncbi:MAG: hypothetical protein ACXABY_15320, partial [Candidatus Thorarchaeota archaeon]